MWEKLKLTAGIIWASPITLLAFIFYIAPMWALRQYRYAGWDGLAWRWDYVVRSPLYLRTKFDKFVDEKWRRWGGSAMGNIINIKVYKGSRESITVTHEHEHVIQCMRLGIFQPILYGIYTLLAKFVLRKADPYYDNPFEVDARRAADQLIDVPGTVRRIKEMAAKEKSKS